MKNRFIFAIVCIFLFLTIPSVCRSMDTESPDKFAERICQIIEKNRGGLLPHLINMEFEFKAAISEDELREVGFIDEGQTYKDFINSTQKKVFDLTSPKRPEMDNKELTCEFVDTGLRTCNEIFEYFMFLSPEFDAGYNYINISPERLQLTADELKLTQCAAFDFKFVNEEIGICDKSEACQTCVESGRELYLCMDCIDCLKKAETKEYFPDKSKDILAFGLFDGDWKIIGRLDMQKPIFVQNLQNPLGFFEEMRKEDLFRSCKEILLDISWGMEKQISEYGTLKDIDNQEDVCQNVLEEYDNAQACNGYVLEKVNQACKPDTYDIKILGEYTYEIKAVPDYEDACCICITEDAVHPRGQKECADKEECVCDHDVLKNHNSE